MFTKEARMFDVHYLDDQQKRRPGMGQQDDDTIDQDQREDMPEDLDTDI